MQDDVGVANWSNRPPSDTTAADDDVFDFRAGVDAPLTDR
jgi:hypothetical protein